MGKRLGLGVVREARNESRHVVPRRHATICNGEWRRESNGVEAERREGPARGGGGGGDGGGRGPGRGGPDEQLRNGDSRVTPRAQMQRPGSPRHAVTSFWSRLHAPWPPCSS